MIVRRKNIVIFIHSINTMHNGYGLVRHFQSIIIMIYKYTFCIKLIVFHL